MLSPRDIEKITSRADFVGFVKRMREDLTAGSPEWPNGDLTSYWEALESWIEDSSGYFENHDIDPEEISAWRWLAMALAAARIYE
jgi:hypothetical protein